MPGLEQSLWLIRCNHSDEACMLGGEGEVLGTGSRKRAHLTWKKQQDHDRGSGDGYGGQGSAESGQARKEVTHASSSSEPK